MASILASVLCARLGTGTVLLETLPEILGTCCLALVAVGAIRKLREVRSWPRRLMAVGSVGAAVVELIWIAQVILDCQYDFWYDNWEQLHKWMVLRDRLFLTGIAAFAIRRDPCPP